MSQDMPLLFADSMLPPVMPGVGQQGVNPLANQQDSSKSFLLKFQQVMGAEGLSTDVGGGGKAAVPVTAMWQGMVKSGKPLPEILSEFTDLTGIALPEELFVGLTDEKSQALAVTEYLNQNFSGITLAEVVPPQQQALLASLIAEYAPQASKEAATQAADVATRVGVDERQQARLMSAQEFIAQRGQVLEAGQQARAPAAEAAPVVNQAVAENTLNNTTTNRTAAVATDAAATTTATATAGAQDSGAGSSDSGSQSQTARDFLRHLAQSNNQFSLQQDGSSGLAGLRPGAGEGNGLSGLMSSLINGAKPTGLNSSLPGQAPLSTSIHMPLHDARWGGELSNRITWMAQERIQSAEIRLNPERMGPIELRIEFNDDQARVVFSSQNAAVRDSIENALPRLREMFSAQGLNLSDAQITDQSLAQERQQRQFQDGRGGEGQRGLLNAGTDEEIGIERLHTIIDPHTFEPVTRTSIDFYA